MDNHSKLSLFETCPVPKAVRTLALPSVVGQIILVIYNMADAFFIGMTGNVAMLTAVTICMPALMFLSAISNLFGIGGAGMISRALGHDSLEQAQMVSGFSIWGCLLLSAGYVLLARLLQAPFIHLLGGGDAVVFGYARTYLTCTVCNFGIAASMSTMFSHLIRAEGFAFHASVGITMGGILNILLDPLFMFVLLPDGQEVFGAALATGLSNLAALIYYLAVILKKKGPASVICFRFPGKALTRELVGGVLSTGLPACLMTLFENLSFMLLDNLMAENGIRYQAGLGVAKKINMLAHCITRGISQGVLPMIGFNYSAGNTKRMHLTVQRSMLLCVTSSAVCMAGSILLSRPLIKLFIQSDAAALEYGARFLRILCIGCPFSACAYALISFFQAVGKGRKSTALAMLRKGILDIPLMLLMRHWLDGCGLVMATPIADAACCAVSLALYFRFMQSADLLAGEPPRRS